MSWPLQQPLWLVRFHPLLKFISGRVTDIGRMPIKREKGGSQRNWENAQIPVLITRMYRLWWDLEVQKDPLRSEGSAKPFPRSHLADKGLNENILRHIPLSSCIVGATRTKGLRCINSLVRVPRSVWCRSSFGWSIIVIWYRLSVEHSASEIPETHAILTAPHWEGKI